MEKEMRPMTTEMLKKGYLLFPKALFEEQMNMKKMCIRNRWYIF